MLNGIGRWMNTVEHRTAFNWNGICVVRTMLVSTAKSTIPPSEILLTQTAQWTFNEMPFSIINRLTNIIDYDFMLIKDSHQINALLDLQSDVDAAFFCNFWPNYADRIMLLCDAFCQRSNVKLVFWFAISDNLSNTPGATHAKPTEQKDSDDAMDERKTHQTKLRCARELTKLTISLFSKWLNNSNSRRIYRHPSMRTTQIIAIITWFPLGSDMKTVISIHVTSHGVNKSHNTQSLSPVIHSQNTFL